MDISGHEKNFVPTGAKKGPLLYAVLINTKLKNALNNNPMNRTNDK